MRRYRLTAAMPDGSPVTVADHLPLPAALRFRAADIPAALRARLRRESGHHTMRDRYAAELTMQVAPTPEAERFDEDSP